MFRVEHEPQNLSNFPQRRTIILTDRWALQISQKSALHRSDTLGWGMSLLERVYICNRCGDGRAGTRAKTIQQVKDLLQNDSTLSVLAASSTLQLSPTMVNHNLRNGLYFPYKFHNLKARNEHDEQKRLELAEHCYPHSRRVTQNSYQNCFPMNVCIASTVSPKSRMWEIGVLSVHMRTNQLVWTVQVFWHFVSYQKRVIGLFFENENVTGAIYRNWLSHHAIPRFRFLRKDYISTVRSFFALFNPS